MPDLLQPLRINAVELLRQPGAVRDVTLDIAAAPLEAEHERLVGELHVDLRLTARNDSIDVDGTVSANWESACRRCLREVSGTAVGAVDERYQIELLDPDAYLIEDGQLDLVPLVRESMLLELESEVLCRDDCAGLCPICGVDRNTTECSCDTTVIDDRWAALEGFVPDDD